jgi:hypothetical protein
MRRNHFSDFYKTSNHISYEFCSHRGLNIVAFTPNGVFFLLLLRRKLYYLQGIDLPSTLLVVLGQLIVHGGAQQSGHLLLGPLLCLLCLGYL